jgi:hypothetical protein
MCVTTHITNDLRWDFSRSNTKAGNCWYPWTMAGEYSVRNSRKVVFFRNRCKQPNSPEAISLVISPRSEKKPQVIWPSANLKGTQDWEFFWLRFWNLHYFFANYVKILIFYKKIFLIGPLLGEVRFFRVVLGLRRMEKNFEVGQKFLFYFLQFWTLTMTQY